MYRDFSTGGISLARWTNDPCGDERPMPVKRNATGRKILDGRMVDGGMEETAARVFGGIEARVAEASPLQLQTTDRTFTIFPRPVSPPIR